MIMFGESGLPAPPGSDVFGTLVKASEAQHSTAEVVSAPGEEARGIGDVIDVGLVNVNHPATSNAIDAMHVCTTSPNRQTGPPRLVHQVHRCWIVVTFCFSCSIAIVKWIGGEDQNLHPFRDDHSETQSDHNRSSQVP